MIEIPFSTNQKFEGRREVYHTSGLLKIGGPSHFLHNFAHPDIIWSWFWKSTSVCWPLINDLYYTPYPIIYNIYSTHDIYPWLLPMVYPYISPWLEGWALKNSDVLRTWWIILLSRMLSSRNAGTSALGDFCFFFWRKKKQKLVGSFKHEFYVPENIWDGIILPIHELIFFKMVKTTNQKRHVRASGSCIMVALCCAKAIVDLSKGRFQVFFVGCVPKDWIFQICHFWGWRVCSTDQVRCNCNFVPTLFELEH